MLSVRHGGRLSRGSADNDRVCAVGNLEFDQFAKLVIVHTPVFIHGGYDCNACTFENCHLNSSFILLYYFILRCLFRL